MCAHTHDDGRLDNIPFPVGCPEVQVSLPGKQNHLCALEGTFGACLVDLLSTHIMAHLHLIAEAGFSQKCTLLFWRSSTSAAGVSR